MAKTMPLADLARALAPHAVAVAEQLTGAPPTSRGGRQVRFRGKGSLAVVTGGDEMGSFFDHDPEGPGPSHGDTIDLIANLRSCSISEAASWGR